MGGGRESDSSGAEVFDCELIRCFEGVLKAEQRVNPSCGLIDALLPFGVWLMPTLK